MELNKEQQMNDIEVEVGKSLVSLIDGKFISIYTEEEYTYGCSMTIPEWEDIKINVDNLIKSSKGGSMNDTDYLLSGNTNKERILNSINEAEEYNSSKSSIDRNEPTIDSDAVIKMMDNMSLAELKILKATCSVLINFKLNEAMNNK